MSAAPPPTGTVTFLFTDIEGSTRLWMQHPAAMREALGRHHTLLQEAIEANGGYVFQIVGDAFCAAFATAGQGVAAAVAAQRALGRDTWGATGPIRVRMALHSGPAELRAGEHRSGEYVSGITLSHTARYLAAAHGGQILVSRATREQLGGDVGARAELRDLGPHRLRDLPRAEPIYQVVVPDLPAAFPALRSLAMGPGNLPRQLTTFIGRERLMEEARRRIETSRLLTLTGPGGSGKTRLALEVGAALHGRCPDGVWLLEFGSIAEPEHVAAVLGRALEVREEAGRPLRDTLVDHLRGRRALLIFDGCEHLLDACASLADAVLRGGPEVTILASSREALGVAGEAVLGVPPMALPETARALSLEELARVEAIRLFVERATAASAEFALTEATAAAVSQICARLDGIPLAIELAAARVPALSVQGIASHLDERFRLLTGGNRTALPRHRTLRGLIDWSHDLLTEAERRLFRRVSVFVGGWSLDAAGTVCAGAGVERTDVVDLIGRLVDKSLCVAVGADAEPRYRLLETIRQYGLEQLDASPDADLARDRHRDFYLTLAEQAEERLQGPHQVTWLNRLEADHDNLRAALRRSIDRDELEPALRLGSALWPFWDTHGHVGEGHEWLDELLGRVRARLPSTATPMARRGLAKVLDGAAYMRTRRSEFAKARELQAEGLAVWRELGDRRGIARALDRLGDLAGGLGDRVAGRALLNESLALFRELGDRRGTAHVLTNLGGIAVFERDGLTARRLFEECVALFESIQDSRGLAHALTSLGDVLATEGDDARAEALFLRSLRLAEELGDNHAIAAALRSLGDVARQRGDPVRARGHYEECLTRFRDMRDTYCEAKSLVGLALASHARGEHAVARTQADQGLALLRAADARSELAPGVAQLAQAALDAGDATRAAGLLDEGLTLYVKLQDERGVLASLERVAQLAAAHGRFAAALTLMAATEVWRRASRLPAPVADSDVRRRVVEAARARLDAATGSAAWSTGASQTVDEAIAYAREQLASLAASQ